MIKIKNLGQFFKKIFWKIGENPLLTLLILLILTFIFSGLIFYQYVFLAEKKEPQIIERPIQFKEELYQKILTEWEERQKKFDQVEQKEYRDLFQIFPEKLTE
jgi:hypothetical protein